VEKDGFFARIVVTHIRELYQSDINSIKHSLPASRGLHACALPRDGERLT
jgi:hypothetical protein